MRLILAGLLVLFSVSLAHAEDVKLPREDLQAAVNYLIKQPYDQVWTILPKLLAAQAIPFEPKPEPKPEPPKDEAK